MDRASKEEITRKRKEYARITEELFDAPRMSSEYVLELLEKKRDLAGDIYVDLKEEERILQSDMWYWVADIEALQKAIDRRKFPDGYPSSGEETEEDEKEPQSLNESQCASSGEETEEDEEESQCLNESQCATCSAREYLEYLNSLGYPDSEEDETRYLKAEQELEEMESEDSPDCAACLARKEQEYLEEEKSSRYDSSE